MARFCFVSMASTAHCDFGGMSYVRTAQALLEHGHDVHWLLAGDGSDEGTERVFRMLSSRAIPYELIPGLPLRATDPLDGLRLGVSKVESMVQEGRYDAVVLDRICLAGAYAAHRANVPWACVGTDGREWAAEPAAGHQRSGRRPEGRRIAKLERLAELMLSDGYPQPSRMSAWATSPFLNLSFFPRAFFEAGNAADIPRQSHFLGSGRALDDEGTGSTLLLTRGNTFNRRLFRQTVLGLREFLQQLPVDTLILTGAQEVSERVRRVFADQPRVLIKDWVPYDQAYSDARVVIGHGGTSHVWHGMDRGVPLLAVPAIGDQKFGAQRIEALGVGRAVVAELRPPRGGGDGGPLQGDGAAQPHIRRRDLMDALHALWTEPGPRQRAKQFSLAMQGGGGVAGAAALLEQLVDHKAPVTTCIEPRCCC